MAKVLGLMEITWKGVSIPIEDGGTVKLGGLQNTGVTTGQRRDRAQSFEPSMIEATTNLFEGQELGAIYDTTEGELQVRCDTGQLIAFPDAFMTERPQATAGEGGKLALKWEAGRYREVSA